MARDSLWKRRLGRLWSGESRAFLGLAGVFPEVVLLAAFFALSHWLKAGATLPPEDYREPVILLAYVSNLLVRWKLGVVGLLGLGFLVWRRKHLAARWSDLSHGASLRLIVGGAIVALAWPLATVEYDYFADSAHWLDRLLLLGVAMSVVRRPAFVLAFLAIGYPMVFEFAAPIGNYPWAYYGMPLHVLTLFAAWFLLAFPGAPARSARVAPFLLVLLCLIAGHYWIPGVAKLRIGWLFDNQVFYLLPATYANGWLAFLSPETISSFAKGLALVNLPMKLVALILECGCLFMVAGKRKALLFFLSGFILFHFAILGISGILLWQWILVELAVLYLVWQKRIVGEAAFFTPSRRALAVGIIASAPLWLLAPALSWYDSPANYVYRFESVEPDGTRYSLGARFFAPFDKQFSFSAFPYLMPERKLLAITWGATTKDIALELRKAKSPSEIQAVEQSLGSLVYDQQRVHRMREFLVRYAGNYNRAPERKSWFRFVAAPPGIVTWSRPDALLAGRTIGRIEVTQVLSWFDTQHYQEIRRVPVLSVDAPR